MTEKGETMINTESVKEGNSNMPEFKWDSVEEYASELVLKSLEHHWPKHEMKIASEEVAGVQVYDTDAL